MEEVAPPIAKPVKSPAVTPPPGAGSLAAAFEKEALTPLPVGTQTETWQKKHVAKLANEKW